MASDVDAFNEALEMEPGARAAFIEARYADDPERGHELLRLLDAHERADREGFDARTSRALPASERVPRSIGAYRIVEVLGQGGMGVVYAAEQSEPFRRRVAIKVIKLGMDSAEVLARFEAERQAMAIMDHPGVAKAFDAGVTEQGRPYFVMELVEGISLTEYCVQNRVSLRDRLRLFADVCAAIRHAHQKGVIHRDLKPSNILVAVHGGRPAPKVIDFGVAKATSARLTDRTLFTEHGRVIGTPEYMSPEQADPSGLDVDTRADVYSLGVVLYELLTDVLPFDSQELRAKGYAEILRTVREVDPPRPSARLNELGAGRGRMHPRARVLRGELDWIVMRAIEKDRTRRYATANALAEDVERYLADLPLLAGPPSLAYAVRKTLARHRYLTAMVAIVTVSAIVGVAGLATGLMRARDAEAEASQRAENAQASAAFLERMLFQADPELGGASVTLLEMLNSAGRSIGPELGPYPEVEASVRESFGVAYRRRSMFTKAEPHLRRSLALRTELFGDAHPATARSSIALANLLFEHEGSVGESLELLVRALDGLAAGGLVGTGAEAWLQLDIGIVRLAGDRLMEAERAFKRCRELLARHRGAEHPDVSRPVRGLASVALARGELDAAERLARRAVALCRVEGEAYLLARAQTVLAEVLIALGRYDEASAQLDLSGGEFFGTVGQQHIRIAERQAVLGELHLSLGEFGAAEDILGRCEAMRRRLLREDHWAVLEARLLRQRVEIGRGAVGPAGPELAAIGRAVEGSLGTDHPLAIRVEEVLLERATVIGDTGAIAEHGRRLEGQRRSRAQRLGIADGG